MLDLRRWIWGVSLCGYVRVGGVSRKGGGGLLVFFCADKAGLVHEMRDGVGFVCVLGYFVYDPHGGE